VHLGDAADNSEAIGTIKRIVGAYLSTVGEKLSTAGTDDPAPFSARLTLIVRRFGSVAEMARAIGVSDNAIYKWMAGRGQPSLSSLVAIARAARVSIEWLATGQEPAAMGPSADVAAAYYFPPRGDAGFAEASRSSIRSPLIVDWLAFRRDWLARMVGRAGAESEIVLLEAAGDAMSPAISEGDLLVVDLSQKNPIHDGIYVLDDDSGPIVRRVYRQGEGGAVLIRADNPAYSAGAMITSRPPILGRVIWSGGRC
jgi:phage repressor protein C with HTH and peptisase S24 domain